MRELSEKLLYYNMPSNMKEFIYSRMAQIEYRLSKDCVEKIELASLVSGFVEARHVKNNWVLCHIEIFNFEINKYIIKFIW